MVDDPVFISEEVTNSMIYAEVKGLRTDFNSIEKRVSNNSLRIKLMGGGIGLLGVLVALVGVLR